PRPAGPVAITRPRPARRNVRAVVLGSSTGGPEALSRVLRGLTEPLPVPMVVVQHMPPVFTKQLAARLDRLGPSTVVEATGEEVLRPGTVYIAPGDLHLELAKGPAGIRTRTTTDPPVNFCRPSVDVMFRSAVAVFGGDLLAVVLTGMGSDGRTGCEGLVRAGGSVIVQDEQSSVVWGMPGSVATAGLAHQILPLDEIASATARAVAAGRAA
ncbi:CheB methylesterase domain-containing protein, partial [Cellulomonas bogoriensis]|uniref:CheB methylesterase domain-containing protein n=1 Tax=Cellulomonas bogoriensis TaxID=301388 RepID=UPI00054FBEA7